MSKRSWVPVGVFVCMAVVAGLNSGSAGAVVSTKPATWTPDVISSNATVRQLVQCGSTMYAVGSFSRISQGGATYTRNNAFSFSATNGAVTSWNPNVNGEVNSIAFSPSCAIAYLGGSFTSVAGTADHNLAAISPTTAAAVAGFGHTTNGEVKTVMMVNGGQDLMVGGRFTTINGSSKAYYASVSPASGAVNSYFSATIAGKLPGNAGSTMVYNQQLSARGDRLLFEGDFTTVGGKGRLQLTELDLSSTAATVDPWVNSKLASTYCSSSEEFYARAAAFSPDESTIYMATTGYRGSSPYCDAVTAFANTPTAPVKWINKTGGDSLYSVAAGPSDVYVGGHERWANNPFGSDSCGAGCVGRQGIGDISATTGLATSWNPGRGRGHGAEDMLITPAGLWVASDTFFNANDCGGVYHPGICFLPGAA